MMLVKEKEYNAMFERNKTASSIVRIMLVSLPSKSSLQDNPKRIFFEFSDRKETSPFVCQLYDRKNLRQRNRYRI